MDTHGIVYVLTNPVMPGIVKIGMTERSNIDKRLRELYTTGVPVPFECAYACKVDPADCSKIEKALHKAFEPQRVNANREFFRIQPAQAIAILELFNQGDITQEVEEEIQNDLTDDDKLASVKVRSKRPKFDMYEMGMHNGDVLQFVHDSNITAVVVSNRRVEYNGEEYSLSALSSELLGYKHKCAPCPHWTYNGRSMADIYDETYPFED